MKEVLFSPSINRTEAFAKFIINCALEALKILIEKPAANGLNNGELFLSYNEPVLLVL